MVDQDAPATDIAALLRGRAFVDVSGRRKVRVLGADAISWLHDLLTADIADLEPGTSCRSLLLTPTGHVRADVQVLRRPDDALLVQAADQPEDIGALLAPYLLSSDVVLEDVTDDLVILALPRATSAPSGTTSFAPSILGAGVDVIDAAGAAERLRTALLDEGFAEASAEAAEARRIIDGVPRMGSEFDQRSLPAEAGLDDLIDTTKGCFLGQESVARVRNLGHPPRVLRHVRGSDVFATGTSVLDGDAIVGSVTSAARVDDRSIGFVRIAWAAATARLTDTDGHPLVDVVTAG